MVRILYSVLILKRLSNMKKIILLMSFIVLTTIAHAFNYGSITIYQDGEWGAPFYIKTSVVYIVFNQTIVKRLRGVFGLFTLGERTVDIDTPIC